MKSWVNTGRLLKLLYRVLISRSTSIPIIHYTCLTLYLNTYYTLYLSHPLSQYLLLLLLYLYHSQCLVIHSTFARPDHISNFLSHYLLYLPPSQLSPRCWHSPGMLPRTWQPSNHSWRSAKAYGHSWYHRPIGT